jgi:vacuolar-type H+-ATPase subunit H
MFRQVLPLRLKASSSLPITIETAVAHMPEQANPFAATAEDASSSAEISARVSAVFTAAEKAAQHMLTMAREEADDIRRRAHSDGEALRAQSRVEAERETGVLIEQARQEAAAIMEEAREAAGRIQVEAEARKLRLREEVRLIGERIDWAHDGLREVAARLDGLFPEERAALAAEPDGNAEASEAERD